MFNLTTTQIGDIPPLADAWSILMWLSGILMVFILMSTFFRIYVRIADRTMEWDDISIIVVVLLSIVRLGFQIAQANYGNGKHWIYLSSYDYTMINKYGWYAQLFYHSAIAFLKASICLLAIRIKDTKVLRTVLFTVMTGVLFTNFGSMIILVECHPIGFWREPSANCWSSKILIYSINATMAYSVMTDLILSFLPIFVVWKTQISFRSKIYVYSLTGFGLVATGFGTIKAVFLNIQATDLGWGSCIAAVWSNLELFLGIIAANLAISHVAYVHFFHHDHTHTRTSRLSLSTLLRGDGISRTKTVIECGNQRPATSRSENSEIELVPGIQKRMEFWVSEELDCRG